MRVISRSPRTTRALGAFLARELLAHPLRIRRATVIALQGPLGAGKTTFIGGFARAAGVRQNLPSPTFIFARRYPLRRGRYRNLVHVDAYRISRATKKTLAPLGLMETFTDPRNLVLVEWPERIGRALPPQAIRIAFRHGRSETERAIRFSRS